MKSNVKKYDQQNGIATVAGWSVEWKITPNGNVWINQDHMQRVPGFMGCSPNARSEMMASVIQMIEDNHKLE
jgi:hypothetical protein